VGDATFEEVLDMLSIAPDQIRPLRRVEYDQLIELGAFDDERIELLYGQLVTMSPIGTPHSFAVQRLMEILVPHLLGRATVRVGQPFAVDEHSEPEPDLLIAPPREYADAHPTEAWLVIEVSESSLSKDQGLKARLYAEAKVPEYWIVNLVEQRIDVYRHPVASTYTQRSSYRKGQALGVPRFPDVKIQVDDVIR
jgi:Uma2 family endonuclease